MIMQSIATCFIYVYHNVQESWAGGGEWGWRIDTAKSDSAGEGRPERLILPGGGGLFPRARESQIRSHIHNERLVIWSWDQARFSVKHKTDVIRVQYVCLDAEMRFTKIIHLCTVHLVTAYCTYSTLSSHTLHRRAKSTRKWLEEEIWEMWR